MGYRTILEKIAKTGPASPKDISESRYRENITRLRCRKLVDRGLLRQITHDIYELSDAGQQYLSGDQSFSLATSDPGTKQITAKSSQNIPDNRITDITEMDAETMKQFNYEWYQDPQGDYGLVNESPKRTERRIWNVQDLELDRVIEEFPIREPVVQQCAHWIRAISGKHFFPDANHRTTMASLKALLQINNIQIINNWPGRHIERTVLKSKFIRNFIVDIRFDNLWDRDEHYLLWHRHFRNLFYDFEEIHYHHVPTGILKRALEQAREAK